MPRALSAKTFQFCLSLWTLNSGSFGSSLSGLFFFGAEVFGEGDLLELLLRRTLLLGLGVKVLDWEDLGRGESLES